MFANLLGSDPLNMLQIFSFPKETSPEPVNPLDCPQGHFENGEKM
jgi:hypothetical protein